MRTLLMSTRRGGGGVKQRKALLAVVTLMVLLFPVVSMAGMWMDPGDVLDGTLVWSTELGAANDWANVATSFSYEITRPLDESAPLTYSYTFTAPTSSNALSHLILQVSVGSDLPEGLPAFALDNPMDFINTEGYSLDDLLLDDYEGSGASQPNPYMPAGMYGLKFEDLFEGEGTWTVTFDSYRLPMEGSFYAKGGRDNAAWNLGLDPQHPDGAMILVPDTAYVPVPGAVLLGSMGLGVAGSILRRRRARS